MTWHPDGGLDAARRALIDLVRTPDAMRREWSRRGAPALDGDGAREAAVLMLFGPAVGSDELQLLLLSRAETLSSHPGQVAFPGGRLEPDDRDAVAAALREAQEETDLDPSGVEVLGTLTPLPLAFSRHLVTPVVGWWERPTPVRVVDEGESSHVFALPVAELVDPDNRCTVVLRRDEVEVRTPGFTVAADGVDHLVWGFTAGVLDALLDELGWAVPWDAAREVEIRP